jgi:hypothetical protein
VGRMASMSCTENYNGVFQKMKIAVAFLSSQNFFGGIYLINP